MTSPDSLNRRLLQQVLKVADERGLDQARLATEAGLKPETLSRAKKRANMDLSTLASLASVVGLQVVLQPSVSKVPPTLRHPIENPAPLADARFGLAWSNPSAKEDVLLRNALLQGRFHAILEAAAQDGVFFVRQQMKQLRDSGDLSERQGANLERMVTSIERGFEDEGTHATA